MHTNRITDYTVCKVDNILLLLLLDTDITSRYIIHLCLTSNNLSMPIMLVGNSCSLLTSFARYNYVYLLLLLYGRKNQGKNYFLHFST